MAEFRLKPFNLFSSAVFYCCLWTAQTTQAHTPYLLPSAFEPVINDLITLDASFAERFFVPEVVFDGGQFEVITPGGLVVAPDTEVALKTRNVLEHVLTDEGTYRFSTGKRLGGVFTVYEKGGERHTAHGKSAEIPKDAKVVEQYQSLTLAETYVTKGGPTDKALRPRKIGLEIAALTHPNDVFAGDKADFRVLFNGKPLPKATIDIYLAADQFSLDKANFSLSSAGDGKFSFLPEQHGVYLMRVRHRAPAPPEADAPEISHTYTLVIEAYN